MVLQIPQGQLQNPVDIKQDSTPYSLFANVIGVVPADTDISIVKALHADIFKRSFPRIQYARLDRKTTVVNRLYLETRQFVFLKPIEMPAYVKVKPAEQELSRFGIDEKRELLLVLSIPILDELGLGANAVTIGDKVIYDRTEYQVLSIVRDSYFVNWNISLELVCTLNRFRLGE
jgi:hypothetical protein